MASLAFISGLRASAAGLWLYAASTRLESPEPVSPGRLHSHLSLCRWLVSAASGPHPHPHPLLLLELGCTGECGAALFLDVAPSVQGAGRILFISAVARTAMPSQGKSCRAGWLGQHLISLPAHWMQEAERFCRPLGHEILGSSI